MSIPICSFYFHNCQDVKDPDGLKITYISLLPLDEKIHPIILHILETISRDYAYQKNKNTSEVKVHLSISPEKGLIIKSPVERALEIAINKIDLVTFMINSTCLQQSVALFNQIGLLNSYEIYLKICLFSSKMPKP